MRVLSLLAPVMLAGASILVVPIVRRLHPADATRTLVVLMAASATGTMAWAIVLSGALIADLTTVGHSGPIGSWFHGHAVFGRGAGLAALVLLVYASGAVLRVGRAYRRARLHVPRDAGEVSLLESDTISASALPGRGARVVVSEGLVAALDHDEVGAVLAHERAHHSLGHHKLAVVALVASCVCPWLIPVRREVAFMIERWADEHAARIVGSRPLVARAIARAALSPKGFEPGLAFSRQHVLRRVRALLEETPTEITPIGTVTVAGSSVAATGIASTTLQLHHAIPGFG